MRTTLALACLFSSVASAQSPEVSQSAPAGGLGDWFDGSSGHGTRGVYRVEGAYGIPAGNIVLVLGGSYSRASDMFEPGDVNERHAQHITVAWAPIANLELWARQSTVSNRNLNFEPATTQTLGDPVLGFKYSIPMSPSMGVAAGVTVLLPTSARGTGVKPDAYVLTGYAAASMHAASWLAVSANAGYVLDNSDKIFKREILPVQRFTAGISASDQVLFGVGANTYFAAGDVIAVGPFAELSGNYMVNADTDQSPIRATAGLRIFPFGPSSVELAVGADYAIMGTPVVDAATAVGGIPPWEAFVQLSAHLGARGGTATVCSSDSACSGGQVCVDGLCGRVKEVIKEVVKEVSKASPTFTIEGGVFDQTSGEPVGNATVTVSGMQGSALAVDYKTGGFKSWPIPSGDGLIKITASAPGFRPAEQTIPKGQPGEVKQLAFKIQSTGVAATGEIQGTLKDGRSGNPVASGQVFIPVLNQKVATDAEGKFTAQVKAGRYQVLITHKKYVTQKKEIEIRAGDVVILNVDLTPKR